MGLRLLGFFGLWVLTIGSCLAQDVTHESTISGLLLRPMYKIVEESTKGPLPDLRQSETGTLICITGDFHNSDVLIITGKEVIPIDRLLKSSQEIAMQIGRPDTDFIVAVGRRLQYVDLEFNPYIVKDQWTSKASIPIGSLMQRLSRLNLPKPIAIVAENSDELDIRFRGAKINKGIALLPSEIKLDDTFEFQITRHWYGLIGITLLAGLILGVAIGLPIYVLRKSRSLKETVPDTPFAAPPISLEEAQARYKEASKPFRWISLAPILPFLLIPALIPLLEDGFHWLPTGFNPRWIIFMILPMLLTLPIIAVRNRKQPKHEEPESDRTMRALRRILFPVGFSVVGLMLVLTFPQITRWLPANIFRVTFLTVMFGGLAIALILNFRDAQSRKTALKQGDPDFDAAMEFAKKAKVHVSKVEINPDLSGVNAAATIFGRVFVTPGLREKLSLEERRAIIAHEIGHIKGQHVPIFMLIGFLALGIVIFGAGQIRDVSQNWPTSIRALVNSPLLIWVPQFAISGLLMTPIRRKAELYADRFALEQTQDYSVIATALAKVHLFNGSPHTLSTRDERIASHPSLTKRLDSLRSSAKELNLPIDETEVNRIFTEGLPNQESCSEGTA